jgi:hypothetical protein
VPTKSIAIDHIKDLIRKEKFKEALSVLVSPPTPKYPDLVHPIIRVLPTISGINKIKKYLIRMVCINGEKRLSQLLYITRKIILREFYLICIIDNRVSVCQMPMIISIINSRNPEGWLRLHTHRL